MRKVSIKVFCFSLITLQLLLLFGCAGSNEIDTLALTTAIGIDRAEDGYLLSYQVLNPKSITKNSTVSQSPVAIYSETGKDLLETARSIISQSSRKLFFSHLRIVVLGESVVKEGIKDILDFFVREHELRTDFYFVVANGTTANKILKVLPPIEPNTGIEMYASMEASQKAWAKVTEEKILDVTNSITSSGKSLVLPGVVIINEKDNSETIDVLTYSDGTKLKFKNLCIFRNDKMTGWLNQDDELAYSFITGNVKNTIKSINYGNANEISVEIISAKSHIKAIMPADRKPAINVTLDIKFNITSIMREVDVLNNEFEEKINKRFEEEIKAACDEAVKRCQEEHKSDIFGFGEAVHRAYPNYWREVQDNWNNEFEKLPVNISVKAKLSGLGEVIR